MRRVVVTGANRGLGLAFVRLFAADGDRVAATVRRPGDADALRGLGGVTVHQLDVTDPGSVAAAAAAIGDELGTVDVLVNNAGVWAAGASVGPLGELDADAVAAVLRTNAVGPLIVTQALAPQLAGGIVANMSSGLGSLGRATPRINYGYAVSKAALNMVTRQLAAELRDQGTAVVALDPGWVRTDLGGPNARVSPEESVRGLAAVLDRVDVADTGRWFNRRGEEVDW